MESVFRIRRTPLSILLFIAAAGIAVPTAFAQQAKQANLLRAYSLVVPLRGATSATTRSAVAASATIPLWDYSVTSPVDGVTYSGTMVGRSPFFHGARKTNIATFIVPVRIQMPDGNVFDPTAADPACSSAGTALEMVQGSPMLLPAFFLMGITDADTAQYADAFQRANFWSNVSVTGDRYHTVLSPVTTLSPVTFAVPAGKGATYNARTLVGGCGNIGVMDFSAFDNFVQGTLLPSLAASGVGPTNFPMILLYNVVMGYPGDSITSNCCVIGYHAASGSPIQTYAVFEYDSTTVFFGARDISAMSHEVAEWMDDPLGSNPTPLWGHTGQVSGCQGNLETADPLTGKIFRPVRMPNGFTYSPQELAFFSWFYRQSPSIAAVDWYSDNGRFLADAGAICQ